MRKMIGWLMILVMILLSGCGAEGAPRESTAGHTAKDEPRETAETPSQPEQQEGQWAVKLKTVKPERIGSVLTADSFDARLLAYLSAHTESSYMASPLSFRYALGLLLAGAEGETRTELLKALGVESEAEWRNSCELFNGFTEWFAEDLQRDKERFLQDQQHGYLPRDAEAPFRALRVANSVWKREDIRADFTENYRAVIEGSYGAEYRYFTAADAVSRINDWAKVKTEGLIDQLLPEGYNAESLALVLMNALYFKDSWTESFPKELTKEADFRGKNGTVRKEFMHKTDMLSYYEDENSRMVLLPMEGGITMAVVIGDAQDLPAMTAKAARRRVELALPKIDLETSFDQKELVDFLKESGVSLAFTGNADFSGMIDYPVFVDDIIQKTRIKLDEEGVEAAAVTAIMMAESAYEIPTEPVRFTADEPFSFFIYTEAGDFPAILFAGEIRE